MSRTRFAAALVALSAATPASGAFHAPKLWSIGDPGSTYQEWEVFTAPAGPNAPGAPPDVTAAAYNPHGVANAYDAHPESGAFVTSGGNLYSHSTPLLPRITVPGAADPGAAFTTVVLNLRVQGTAPDPDSLTLTAGDAALAPLHAVLTESVPLGGFGGSLLDYWFQWAVEGSPGLVTIDLGAGSSSMSLDRVRVDTFTTAGAGPVLEAPPAAVPEPAALTLMVIAGAVALRRCRA